MYTITYATTFTYYITMYISACQYRYIESVNESYIISSEYMLFMTGGSILESTQAIHQHNKTGSKIKDINVTLY